MSARGEGAPTQLDQYLLTKRSAASCYEWFGAAEGARVLAATAHAIFQRGDWTPTPDRRSVRASFPMTAAGSRWWAVVDQARNVARAGRQFHRTRVAIIAWDDLHALGGPAAALDALDAPFEGALEAPPLVLRALDPLASSARERCECSLGSAAWGALVESLASGDDRIALHAADPAGAPALRDLHAALFALLPEARWERLGAIDAGVCPDASAFDLFLGAAPWPGSTVRSLDALVAARCAPDANPSSPRAATPAEELATLRHAPISDAQAEAIVGAARSGRETRSDAPSANERGVARDARPARTRRGAHGSHILASLAAFACAYALNAWPRARAPISRRDPPVALASRPSLPASAPIGGADAATREPPVASPAAPREVPSSPPLAARSQGDVPRVGAPRTIPAYCAPRPPSAARVGGLRDMSDALLLASYPELAPAAAHGGTGADSRRHGDGE